MHTEEKKRTHGVEAYLTNRIGHATGRGIAKAIWRREWFRQLAAKNPELMKLASEGLVALTSMLELGGDHPIARMANFVAESISMENLELLEQFEKDPENAELAKKVEAKIDAALDKAEKEVFLVLEHVHKDRSCVAVAQYVADTTPPARPGKDGKAFANPSTARIVVTTLSSALNAGKPLCGICYPAVSVRKPEEKQDKAKEPVAGRNFMEFVMRYKADHGEDGKFRKFWHAYLYRLEGPDGPDLAKKFHEAFNARHGYEAFCFVVALPDRNPETGWEEWHHALDALLGQVTPPDSMKKKIEGFIEEEKRQTEEMFRNLFAWLENSNAKRKASIDERKARIAKLDEEWVAGRKAKKTRKTVRRIVIACLLVILASWYAINRVADAPTGSATAEQKETAHVR